MLKLIVECDVGEMNEGIISQFCRVRYCLPDLGCYVVEVSDGDYPKVAGIAGVRAVHTTARIAAQSIVGLGQKGARPQSPSYKHSLTGKGIGVAFLDTGVSPVRDLTQPINRIVAFKDMVNGRKEPYDDNAHGTHVASIAAGNGLASEGRYAGVAPECDVVSVKILNKAGEGDTAEFLAGIQWIITNKSKYNIRVANMSVGTLDFYAAAPLIKAVEIAWDRGIVVCAAAGNNGPNPETVTIPGQSRKVVTVGSSDDHPQSG